MDDESSKSKGGGFSPEEVRSILETGRLSGFVPSPKDAAPAKRESPDVAPRPRSKRGGFHRRPGARNMKEYPLTETELLSLGGLGFLTTLLLSASTFCFGCWFTVYEGVALAPQLDAQAKGYQAALSRLLLIGGISFAVLAVLFMAFGGITVVKIMGDTKHDA